MQACCAVLGRTLGGRVQTKQDWPDVSYCRGWVVGAWGQGVTLLSLPLCLCEFSKTFKGRVYIWLIHAASLSPRTMLAHSRDRGAAF